MGWKSLFLSLSMAVIVPATLAQTPALTAQNDTTQARPADGQNDDEILTTIRTQVQEVNVIFTATDRKGRYLKDLKSGDLAVLEVRLAGRPTRHIDRRQCRRTRARKTSPSPSGH